MLLVYDHRYHAKFDICICCFIERSFNCHYRGYWNDAPARARCQPQLKTQICSNMLELTTVFFLSSRSINLSTKSFSKLSIANTLCIYRHIVFLSDGRNCSISEADTIQIDFHLRKTDLIRRLKFSVQMGLQL